MVTSKQERILHARPELRHRGRGGQRILIDEARTPLIISPARAKKSTDMYVQFARWAPRLKPETDTIGEDAYPSILTDTGIDKLRTFPRALRTSMMK